MMKKEESTNVVIENPLKNRKVAVCPIYREGGWLQEINKNHDGAFLFTGAKFGIKGVPYNTDRRVFIDPLTDEEKQYFALPEIGLGIKLEDFSIHKSPNFWSKFEINLTRDPIVLDLNNPMDYLRYKFLLAQKDLVSPSWIQRLDKGTYKFSIKDDESDQEEEISRIDLEMEVMGYFNNIQGSIRKMSALLALFYERNNIRKKIPSNVTTPFLKTEIHKIIKTNLKDIHEIIQDKYFEERVLVIQGITIGAILRQSGSEYQIVGEEDVLNLRELLEFLRNKKNQATRAKIELQIDNQS